MTYSAFVVRDTIELEKALKLRGRRTTFFLCTNTSIHRECQRRKLDGSLLDEKAFCEDRAELNHWSLERTYELTDRFRHDDDAYLFFQSNFFTLCRLFTQTVKVFDALRRAFEPRRPDELALFEDPASLFPILCARFASQRPDPIVFIKYPPIRRSTKDTAGFIRRIAGVILAWMSNRWARYCLRRAKRRQERIVFLSGALNHLGPVATSLYDRRRARPVFLESEFNFQKFLHCLRTGISYLIIRPGHDRRPTIPPEHSRPGTFVYRSADLSEAVGEVLGKAIDAGFFRLEFTPRSLAELFREYPPEAIVLDEDWAARRPISMIARARDLRCYVISHGVPMAACYKESSPLCGRHASSATLVNSTFEKRQYERDYLDPSHLRVTGVPRYDALPSLNGTSTPAPKAGMPTVLYCAAKMRDADITDLRPWIGLENSFGERSRRYAADIFSVLAAHPGPRCVVKPHYNEEDEWEEYLSALDPQKRVSWCVESHRADVFRLEAGADLVLTIESSVINEAVMLGKPVIVLNYGPEPLSGPYQQHGLVEVATCAEDLEQQILKCLYDKDYLRTLTESRRTHLEEYSGPFDGRNTERVVAEILGERAR